MKPIKWDEPETSKIYKNSNNRSPLYQLPIFSILKYLDHQTSLQSNSHVQPDCMYLKLI